MRSKELQEIVDFASDAARAAGEFTLKHFRTGVAVETKADNTPVTIADRGAEELLRERIEKAFPGHGILGEEFGEKKGREPGRWILDPVDGTFSFICGVPLYCNLVGFEWEGEMVVGVINVPAVGEIVSAAKGLGCTWNGEPARVSDVSELSNARLSVTSAKLHVEHGRYEAYRRIRDACAADRGWPDAYGYVLLATGRVDVVLDPIMSVWDNAALLPVVIEAGGTFTDWKGNATHIAPEAVATNGHLFDAVMEGIRG
jgi:histidinol phosphatase-like enzyme (inositol monophosphatase family)